MSTYSYSYFVMDSLGLVPIGFVQRVPDKATYVIIKLFSSLVLLNTRWVDIPKFLQGSLYLWYRNKILFMLFSQLKVIFGGKGDYHL